MGVSAMFEQDFKLVKELLWLLSREQTSLINADIDALEGLLDEKAQLLQKISASVQLRYNALVKLGFEPNENGMSSWVTKRATPEQVNAGMSSTHFNADKRDEPLEWAVDQQAFHAQPSVLAAVTR